MIIIPIYKIKYIYKIENIVFFFNFIIIILSFYSCQQSGREENVKVNFSLKEEILSPSGPSNKPLRAAVAAMVSPEENFFYYSKIIDFVSKKLGRKVIFKQRKTYQEVNNLLCDHELDFAFICSGGYIDAKEEFDAEILVVPQIRGNTEYYAYIIVRKNSNLNTFEDLKGRTFAFTDPLSNTGCIYPKYLAEKSNQSEERFFSHVIYTYAHDYSIRAVKSRIVDAASVDSLIYDYIQENSARKVDDLKIIKKSMPFGMPPVVVHPSTKFELKQKLQQIFLDMNTDPEGKRILSHLDIDRFVLGKDSEYSFIKKMKMFIQKKSHESQDTSPKTPY